MSGYNTLCIKSHPVIEQAASEVVSCLSLEVCKEKHSNMGRGILLQSEGRLLPELPCNKLQAYSWSSVSVGSFPALWTLVLCKMLRTQCACSL